MSGVPSQAAARVGGPRPDEVIADRPPLRPRAAAVAVGRSVVRSGRLLAEQRVRRPTDRIGWILHFADGSAAPVYRETVLEPATASRPSVLVVCFRLRWVRGRAHAAFRAESLLNTPLFVGFPGFVSKLWLAHDRDHRYRGVYQWDGPDLADAYARALWRVLALVSERGSIRYVVLTGSRREEVLTRPDGLAGAGRPDDAPWWRIVDTERVTE